MDIAHEAVRTATASGLSRPKFGVRCVASGGDLMTRLAILLVVLVVSRPAVANTGEPADSPFDNLMTRMAMIDPQRRMAMIDPLPTLRLMGPGTMQEIRRNAAHRTLQKWTSVGGIFRGWSLSIEEDRPPLKPLNRFSAWPRPRADPKYLMFHCVTTVSRPIAMTIWPLRYGYSFANGIAYRLDLEGDVVLVSFRFDDDRAEDLLMTPLAEDSIGGLVTDSLAKHAVQSDRLTVWVNFVHRSRFNLDTARTKSFLERCDTGDEADGTEKTPAFVEKVLGTLAD